MIDFTFKGSALAFLAKDGDTVFYPGAGADVHDIVIFADHGASCFVHADYLETPDLSGVLEAKGFTVLHAETLTFQDLIETNLFSESESLFATNWQRFANVEAVKTGISRWYVFESGNNTLGLLQVFGEAHWVYEHIFSKRNKAAFGILLQDHGLGGFWTQFGGQSQLYDLATANLPAWLIVGPNTNVWPGYGRSNEYDVGAGGQHDTDRSLWSKQSSNT
jgi:hypothetical protein